MMCISMAAVVPARGNYSRQAGAPAEISRKESTSCKRQERQDRAFVLSGDHVKLATCEHIAQRQTTILRAISIVLADDSGNAMAYMWERSLS